MISNTLPRESIVITGIGLITALYPYQGKEKFWNALCSGEEAVRKNNSPLLRFDKQWPMAVIEHPDLTPDNKFTRLLNDSIRMAIVDSGISSVRKTTMGFCGGTVTGDMLSEEQRWMNPSEPKNDYVPGDSLSNIASQIKIKNLELEKPVRVISTACASGTDAIGFGARMIQMGNPERMIAGGIEVVSDFVLLGFNALKALTPDKVKPFDKHRNGLALGEGAAFVILESETSARKRKAKIYGKILGYATRSDANHLTGPHREGRGLAEAIQKALDNANLNLDDIDYINAHGTGTVYNDLSETRAIKKVFGKKAYQIPISSVKSMLGHSLGATGAVEIICCLLALQTGILPPTINLTKNDPDCDLDYIPNIARNKKIKTTLSLSAGFGGHNSVIILGAS